MTEKPAFDPSQPFEAVASKPPFDPSKPFDAAPVAAPVAAAAPRTWRDSVTDAIMGVPGALSTAGDQGAYLARGARRGVANIAGIPVDLMNGILGLDGSNVSQKPFLGSKHIDEILGGFGAIPEPRPVSTMLERGLSRTGEEIGAAALPVGAAIRAGKMGVEAARKLPILTRMFVEPAAINPTGFLSKEMQTAAAAGTGAAIANEFSPFKKGSAGDNAVDIAGAVGGAGTLGVARVIGKPLKDIWQAVTPWNRDKFSNQNVMEAVTDRIINNADTLPKVEGQPVDTAPLVDAITRGRRVNESLVPGLKDSLGDRTGDPAISNLEYSRSGPNAAQYNARKTENAAVIDTAIQRNTPTGNPADTRAELDLERGRRLTDANVQTRDATDSFERATQALQPVMTGEGRGANIRTALENASEGARAILDQAWRPINRSGARVDMASLADDFTRVGDNLSVAETRRFQPPEAGIPRELSGERPVVPPQVDATGQPVTETITQPINEVTGLRGALTDAAREARTNNRPNEARIIDQHVEALDTYLDNAVTPELRADYDAARAATVDYNDRFTRPQTAVAQTLDRQQGQYRQPDSAVAGKFVQADEGRINDFQALMRETGHDERTVSAVRDQILADVRDRRLLKRPDQLVEYLGRYNTVLSDPRFNATRGQLDNAAGLRRSLDDATGAEAGLARELGTPTNEKGTGTVGRYLQHGPERAQEALQTIIKAKSPGAAAATDELLGFVNHEPKAVAGLQKSFWDLMESRSRSNGETTRTGGRDGVQPWLPNKLQNFLDDPAHAAVAERLWRDSPEHIGNVRRIAEEIQHVDTRTRSKASNTSGTAQGMSNILSPETLQSRFYAYKRGQTSLGFMLTALGSVAARRAVRSAQGEAIEKLLDKALLDPDLAASLLKEHNPANRAALSRTAKAYLGNEASTLTDILDGEPEDKTKSAIMKKDGNGR